MSLQVTDVDLRADLDEVKSDDKLESGDRWLQLKCCNNLSPGTTMLKYACLIVLAAQNTLHILTLRYVRTRTGDMFMTSTAIVISELIKFLFSLLIILLQEGNIRRWLRHLHDNIILQPWDCLKISVPSFIYVLQNNLLFVAVSNLEAAKFQVYYQVKILTTALFSVLILNKVLTKIQWLALLILFCGVSIVQYGSAATKDPTPSDKLDTKQQQPMLGLVAVAVSCLMSGFAGVYFEKILKGTKQSLWLRNVQLGFLGTVIGIIAMEIRDGTSVTEKGFFYGYDGMVWVVILLQSCGGLIVAVVVKYADNILKGFATSAAIIASTLASVVLFDFVLTLSFILGAAIVIVSIYIYGAYNYVPDIPLPHIVQENGSNRHHGRPL